MTRQLLSALNGNNKGQLKKFLDDFKGEPRIAWYPSSGKDFRPLLYLHPNFSQIFPVSVKEPPPPDLFIFTDYYPWEDCSFLDNRTIYKDTRTTVFIESIEELPRLNLTLHDEIVQFPKGSTLTDRAVFLRISINSGRLGNITYPVIYAFAENETFCCNKLIPNKATISHIIHVRYGGGCGGGGHAKGAWLLNVLKKLNCELFITDGRLYWGTGDKFALEFCSVLPKESNARLTQIRDQRNGWDVLYAGLDGMRHKAQGLFVEDGHVSWNLVT